MDAATFQKEAMKHKRLLWRVGWSILQKPEDCTDAVQEALMRAWQRRDTLRSMRAFRPWLLRILSNVCYDMLRSKQRTQPLEDETVAIEPFTEPLLLRDAISHLSPDHRTAIVLHYLEGLTVNEIAKLLDIPSGTVKTRLLYARIHMRKLLHDSIDNEAKELVYEEIGIPQATGRYRARNT